MAVTKKKKDEKVIDLKVGEGTVQKESKGEVTSEKFKIKDPEGYEGPTCTVGFKMGYTKNLGNYESMRIDVSVFLPCYTTELDTVFDFAKEWVDDHMEKTVSDIEKELV